MSAFSVRQLNRDRRHAGSAGHPQIATHPSDAWDRPGVADASMAAGPAAPCARHFRRGTLLPASIASAEQGFERDAERPDTPSRSSAPTPVGLPVPGPDLSSFVLQRLASVPAVPVAGRFSGSASRRARLGAPCAVSAAPARSLRSWEGCRSSPQFLPPGHSRQPPLQRRRPACRSDHGGCSRRLASRDPTAFAARSCRWRSAPVRSGPRPAARIGRLRGAGPPRRWRRP